MYLKKGMKIVILHTNISGQGDPIVFLHTGLQTGLVDYEAQQEFFIKYNKKVILPDLRGHGKSHNDDFNDYFVDSAHDLKETMDYLDIHEAHIVGCSLGALVGLFFVKEYPEYVSSITLSGVMQKMPNNWLELHSKDVESQKKLLKDKKAIGYFNQLHQSDWRRFLYMAQDEEWYPFEQTSDISTINVPILMMVGEGRRDEVESAINYRNMNKNVHTSIIPFASHLVHYEQPELFNLNLKKFLDKISEDKKSFK
ncbi:MAG TPA: alpha/beta hydrolase [Pseudogracilibacillus sp.]|nr:alpha/beta hydrolase [Pseudogracilibacillus sp.]